LGPSAARSRRSGHRLSALDRGARPVRLLHVTLYRILRSLEDQDLGRMAGHFLGPGVPAVRNSWPDSKRNAYQMGSARDQSGAGRLRGLRAHFRPATGAAFAISGRTWIGPVGLVISCLLNS